MFSDKLPKTSIQICQKVDCLKNNAADRLFWHKEIDHQYKFYLATLRAERDARYLIQEHCNLISQVEKAEIENVELRKEIRLLQTELYLMYQRNAHDSVVIDGLQEAHHEVEEFGILESEIGHRAELADKESSQEDTLMEMLKEEISLLKRKDSEDAELISSFKPLEQQLKQVLADQKLKNHLQGMKFKRELETIIEKLQKRNVNLQEVASERTSAIKWVTDTFSSVFGSEMATGSNVMSDGETTSIESSLETDLFETGENNPSFDDFGENFLEMKEKYCEFVAMKEFLDSKNMVNVRVIYDCLMRFCKGVKILADEYLSVFHITADISFMKEYFERLDVMRKKKELTNDENSPHAVLRFEQLSLIYHSLMSEKSFLENLLLYFMATMKNDFEAHCVTLQQTEELFTRFNQPSS